MTNIDILGVTGHRPEKLGGYAPHIQNEVYLFAREFLRDNDPRLVITGMAQGWDMAIAKACINLGLEFNAYVPFEGQESLWPKAAQKEYHHVLSFASAVSIISRGGYHPSKMMARNLAIVDDCTDLGALWNGNKTGGTWNAIQSAEEINRNIIHAWDEFILFKKGLTRRTP